MKAKGFVLLGFLIVTLFAAQSEAMAQAPQGAPPAVEVKPAPPPVAAPLDRKSVV